MQIKSLRIQSCRSFRIDDTTPAGAFERRRKIETYRALRAEGCSEPTALRWTAGAKAGPARAEYQRFYNHVRPPYALDLMTPMEYLLQNRPAESGQSQM